MNQGLDNAMSRGRDNSKDTCELLKKQFPAEVKFLEGHPYRPIRINLEILQLIDTVIRKGGRQ